jgi:tripartite-type tricarboxylate transporter receptor subunit TctC
MVAGAVPAASAAEDFYKDKVVRFVVGYSAGGSFDLYTRLIARHISKHIPGKPLAIVENMTGAGGAIAANQVYKTKPDGLTVGAWASPLILQSILGRGAIKFDARELGYLGVPSAYESVCIFSKASGVVTANDLISSKRTLKISAIGPGTSTSDIPKILKEALNLPIQVIDGYKGGAEARVAVESGEVDGYCGSWDNVTSVWRGAYEAGNIRAIVQTNLTINPRHKDVPLAINLAKTEEARKLITIADDANRGQFIYSTPPGLPKDRLAILQKAFVDVLRDPELLAEARKSNLDIEAIDGPTLTKTVQSLYTMSPATIAKLKEILYPKRP